MPPASSALALYLRPNRLPTFSPTAEQTNVVMPIRQTASGTLTSGSSANVMPTASASMLVASASRSIVLKLNESLPLDSSLDRLSLIMPAPMADSSTNATQWSKAVMYCSNVEPRKNPMVGINA